MSAAESVILPDLLRSETDAGFAGLAALDDRRTRLPTGTSVLVRDVISLIRQVADTTPPFSCWANPARARKSAPAPFMT
jgi:hypothetical protein